MKNFVVNGKKLKNIIDKYSNIDCNADNYYIGGGLDDGKFASKRHEDACNDVGKLTLGQTNSLFSKTLGLSIAEVKELIEFNFGDNLEWHHAGKLPKQYGGGMKKTYFLSAEQIVEFATNFEKIIQEFEEAKENEKREKENEKIKQKQKQEFLISKAKRIERIGETQFWENKNPKIIVCEEMNGKYGWFDSSYKDYNLPRYYTFWEFSNNDDFNQFLELSSGCLKWKSGQAWMY